MLGCRFRKVIAYGLKLKPEDYAFSSARDYCGDHGLPENVIVVDLS